MSASLLLQIKTLKIADIHLCFNYNMFTSFTFLKGFP